MAGMIAVILADAVGCSLLSSVLASVFRIPVFVTTVAMMSVLSAIAGQIITTQGGALGGIGIPSQAVKPMDTPLFKIMILVVFCLACFFLFDFTPVGRQQKFLGGNPVCARLSGIRGNLYTIIGLCDGGYRCGSGRIPDAVYTPSVYHNYGRSIA